ncbi:MAG: hypothetical protein IPM63_12345 [Acidobacteriota bacterium]|nr:MAG: hypothetical protein IPM63_12345 [Acidobacteriota bacterium]
MKKTISLILVLIFSSCSLITDENRKTVNFSSGESAEVFIEEETAGGERVMIVDYRSDTKVRKEDEVERQVGEILKAVEGEAEKRGFTNVIIKYRFPSDRIHTANENVYSGLLFEAEQIENGSWKLRRVN